MRRKINHIALIVFILFIYFPSINVFGDVPISESQVTSLRSLPYSVDQQPSLVVRSRHVESVRFYGASHSSRSGYSRDVGIKSESLWLNLKIQGKEPWSRVAVVFVKNFDVSKYNSIVLWVKANNLKKKMFLGLDDSYWTKNDALETHTSA